MFQQAINQKFLKTPSIKTAINHFVFESMSMLMFRMKNDRSFTIGPKKRG